MSRKRRPVKRKRKRRMPKNKPVIGKKGNILMFQTFLKRNKGDIVSEKSAAKEYLNKLRKIQFDAWGAKKLLEKAGKAGSPRHKGQTRLIKECKKGIKSCLDYYKKHIK